MAIAMHRRLGVFTAATINFNSVELWVSEINGDQRPNWRLASRSTLKGIGLVVNPLGWPQPPKPVPRERTISAYLAAEELQYIDAAALPGFENPEGRRWAVGSAIGAGTNGPKIAAAEIGDVHELGGGRLAIRVRGRNPRLVPVRGCCTDLVRQAIELVQQRPPGSSRRFVLATDPNAGGRLANTVTIGRGRNFSLRRARSTWLTAHLRAETPLAALKVIAGPLSAVTLNDLLSASGDTMSAEDAATKGLGA